MDVEVVSTAPIVRWERQKQSESTAHDGLAGTHGTTRPVAHETLPIHRFAHTHTKTHAHDSLSRTCISVTTVAISAARAEYLVTVPRKAPMAVSISEMWPRRTAHAPSESAGRDS